ncbi:hypothetical protein JHK85_021336 [Glycine max]|nr:hypothetical protein JHK85_021336 [Glycine max]
MWPTLVANKIFKKRLGSSNFIADYPSYKEPLLGIVDIDQNSKTILNDHKDSHKYKVFVSTWNVGGIAPDEDLNIDDLLETCNNSCDIYILGYCQNYFRFQEIVPLKASNVLGSENNEISMKWNSIIREALNKKITHQRDKDAKKQELKNNFPNKKENPAKCCDAPHDFQCIISKQMVGLFISVWIRRDLCPFIRHPSVSCGSISVRFQLHETSFCFVCSHLASGGREGDEKHRNSNVAEIFSRTSFPRGPLLDLPRTILDHDHVILLGDLNYRISLPEETTRLLVEKRDWDSLLANDQTFTMDAAIMAKRQKREEHQHVWCGEGLKQLQYTRIESKLSDHRPVKAMFIAEVRVLPELMKNLQSLFLSERYEQIKTPFEVSTTEDFVNRKRSSFRL